MTPLAEALQNGNLTGEEAEKFLNHFHDPEFRQLFEDYAKEISDPKAKAEQDAYLAQIEAEGRTESIYGKGTQLIVPEPGLVVKTKAAADNLRVYINICSSNKIDVFTQQHSTDPSRPGVHLSLPTALHGKHAKVGTAPDGGTVNVWDIAVHPAALAEAAKRTGFMDTLVTIAIERVEAVSGIKLLRQYKLPKLQYKAVDGHDKPSVMSIRGEEESEVMGGRLQPKTQQQTTAAAVMDTSGPAGSQNRKDCRSSFSFDNRSKPTMHKQRQAIASTSTTRCSVESGMTTPVWDLLERCDTELTQAWQDNRIAITNDPKALVLRVQLPGVLSASAVQLDVSSQAVHLEVPNKYKLDVQLKYPVKDQEGAAKYDKVKQQLTITLPVVPSRVEQNSDLQPGVSAPGVKHCPDACSSLPQQTANDDELHPRLEQEHQQHALEPEPAAADDDKHSSNSSTQQHSTVMVPTSSQQHSVPSPLAPGATSQIEGCQPAGPTEFSRDVDVAATASAEKTPNQLLWDQLHQHHDSAHQELDQSPATQQNCSVDDPKEQQLQVQPRQQGSGQQGLSNPQQKAACEPQPGIGYHCRAILKPRLQSKRVTSAAFD